MDDVQVEAQGIGSRAVEQQQQQQQQPQQHTHLSSSTSGSLRSVFSEEPLFRANGGRGSISTTTTDSTDSSPIAGTSFPGGTTFADTPGTSPDTPAPLPSVGALKQLSSSDSKDSLRFSSTPPAARKARNLKNLALNTSTTFPMSKGLATGLEAPQEAMASPTPLSTNFVRPMPQPRRNPSLSLSIQTPVSTSSPMHFPGEVPPTPSMPRTLPTPSLNRPVARRSFQSSPALPTLFTNRNHPSQRSLSIGGMDQVPAEDDERTYDVPPSREEQPDAYPDGPICIYDPHIDLYLEPTAALARQYDVIFNVASEVQNPFTGEPDPHIPSKSLHAAAQELRGQTIVPDQPGVPEYVHVPWEHNTDIVPDLHELVKVVDDRVQRGKRVLIHCQCGVSRSASLVVAYGIYKNPAMSVQQAYDAVKQKSRWIGPNMNLIMQLQEFRTGMIKAKLGDTQSRSNVRVLHSRDRSNTSADGEATDAQIPQTAPLPQVNNKHMPAPILTQNLEKVMPGPSSAPSGISWILPESIPPLPRPGSLESTSSTTPTVSQALQSMVSTQPLDEAPRPDMSRSTSPRKVVPLAPSHLVVPRLEPVHQTVETPRGVEFAMTSLRPSDLDETFGITSPRTAAFPSVPLAPEEPLMSPRSEEFAMAPVMPRELDDTVTLGLTSPRTESFFELPHRFVAPSPPRPRLQRPVALQPTTEHHEEESQARAALRSQLGFSSGRPASATQHVVPVAPPARPSIPQTQDNVHVQSQAQTSTDSDFPDALMSPRAYEFTSNPMRDALAAATENMTKDASRSASPADPRSPPVRGASPITRDIFGVL